MTLDGLTGVKSWQSSNLKQISFSKQSSERSQSKGVLPPLSGVTIPSLSLPKPWRSLFLKRDDFHF
jgi:hypothetical protein